MQVTNVQDRVTHAVIGGSKRLAVESFGIDDSAEFFQVLSTALYSDKPLATVREVLCNAWDAHIEAGIEVLPVKVTLNREKLVIQDFGSGITPSMMKPIYGTYGRSTKKNIKIVTGGFGLGSKAPFSYTDHFEVISCCDGEKTIYKLSLSNAQLNGKPSIIPIVTVPTDDTGLTVSINLKDEDDYGTFRDIVRKIAAFGEMNVELNGEVIEPIPFSQARHGFLLIKSEKFNENNISSHIRIRYGNVVYPISDHADYTRSYSHIMEFLDKLDTNRNRWRSNKEWLCVVQAEPDTISVTPSRESLSMTSQTTETIKNLLAVVEKEMRSNKLTSVFDKIMTEAIDSTWTHSNPAVLFNPEEKIPNIEKLQRFDGEILTRFYDMGVYYLANNYPKDKGFRSREFMCRLDSMIQFQMPQRGLIQTYKRALIKSGGKPSATGSQWFRRHVTGKLLPQLKADPLMDPSRLVIYTRRLVSNHRSDGPSFIQCHAMSNYTFLQLMPFLRKIVILAYNRGDIERAEDFPICQHWLGNPEESFFYSVPRNSKKVEAARAFFERMGMVIIDLTKAHSWEEATITEPVKRIYAARPRKVGLPRLDQCLDEHGQIKTSLLQDEEAVRITNPKAVFVISPQANCTNRLQNIFRYDHCARTSEAVVRLWGKDIGVVANAPQGKKFMDAGAKEIQEWIQENLLKEYQTDPLIEEHYRNNVEELVGIMMDDRQKNVFEICKYDVELRKKFSLVSPTKERQTDLIRLWDSFTDWEIKGNVNLIAIQALIKSWILTPHADALVKLIKASKSLNMINPGGILGDYKHKSSMTLDEKTTAQKIVLFTLEG